MFGSNSPESSWILTCHNRHKHTHTYIYIYIILYYIISYYIISCYIISCYIISCYIISLWFINLIITNISKIIKTSSRNAARLAGIEVHSSPGDDPQQDLHREPLNIAEEPWKKHGKTMESSELTMLNLKNIGFYMLKVVRIFRLWESEHLFTVRMSNIF